MILICPPSGTTLWVRGLEKGHVHRVTFLGPSSSLQHQSEATFEVNRAGVPGESFRAKQFSM